MAYSTGTRYGRGRTKRRRGPTVKWYDEHGQLRKGELRLLSDEEHTASIWTGQRMVRIDMDRLIQQREGA